MSAPDLVHRNPYARAEYRGIEYSELGGCKECGGATRRWWRYETDGGKRHNVGYFCSFDCLAGHHGFDEADWT